MSEFEDSNSDFSSDDELDLDEAAVQITATKKEPKLELAPEAERIVISPVPEALEPVGANTNKKKKTRTPTPPPPPSAYDEEAAQQRSNYQDALDKRDALKTREQRLQNFVQKKLPSYMRQNKDLALRAKLTKQELDTLGHTLNMVRAFGNISTPDMDLYVYDQARIAQKEQLNERAKRRRLLYENRSFERSYKLGELAQAERELQRVDHVDNNPRMQDEFIREHKKRAELKQQYQNYLKEIHNQV